MHAIYHWIVDVRFTKKQPNRFAFCTLIAYRILSAYEFLSFKVTDTIQNVGSAYSSDAVYLSSDLLICTANNAVPALVTVSSDNALFTTPALLFVPYDGTCYSCTTTNGTQGTCQQEVSKDLDGLVQGRRNSIALAMELRLFCTNPSIFMCRFPTYFSGVYLEHSQWNCPQVNAAANVGSDNYLGTIGQQVITWTNVYHFYGSI